MRRLLLFLLAAFAALAGAQAATDSVKPSRAIGRTHDCANYYPTAAARRNETGDVMVRYDVRADGDISGVTVLKSSGYADLDAAAVLCVRTRWRNTPAYRNGVAVASPNHRAIIAFRLVGEAATPPSAGQPRSNTVGSVALLTLMSVLGGGILLLTAAAFIVVIVIAFPRRRRGVVSGPVVCGKCGVVNIVPEKYFRRRKCTGCGQPFNI